MDWPLVFIVMYIVGLCLWLPGLGWRVIDVRRRRANHRSEQEGRWSGASRLIYAGAALMILGGLGIAVWADPVSGVFSFGVPLITIYFFGPWSGKGSSSTTPSQRLVGVENKKNQADRREEAG